MNGSYLSALVVVLLVGCAAKDGKDGAPGATGPVGPQGATGVVGPIGPAGPTGPAGIAGPAGAPGAVGAPGGPGAAGMTGPAGVVAMATIPATAGTWPVAGPIAFFGASATVTTTATQRVTASISASAQSGGQVSLCQFSVCARAASATTPPVRFEPSAAPMFVATSGVTTFTASESAVLGAGSWQVVLCGSNPGTNDVVCTSSGWVMVTN